MSSNEIQSNPTPLATTAGDTPKVGDILIKDDGETALVIETKKIEGDLYVTYRRGVQGDGYESRQTWKDLKHYRYKLIPAGAFEDLQAETLKALADPGYLEGLDAQANTEQTTALALRSSPAQLQRHLDLAEALRERSIILQRMALAMMGPLQEMTRRMTNRIGHLQTMLDVIAAYAGVYEKVFQIRAGAPAPADTPIAIRQLILYMDEEAGITEWLRGRQGITWASVDAFDEWILAEPAHLDQVAPEPKCIVAIRASRQNRSRDGWPDGDMRENGMAYILIRNGEQVWRVATGFALMDILYPKQGEFAEIVKKASEERAEANDDYRAQNTVMQWQRNIAILQGIIERTDALQPLPGPINLFRPETLGEHLLLIRDGENTLSDGRPSWLNWLRAENSKMQRGDRIVVAPFHYRDISLENRFDRYYHHEMNMPSVPESGIYTVEEVKKTKYDGFKFRVLYMPKDEIWTYEDGYMPRKNRVSFWFFAKDDFVLRYESLNRDDLLYYIGRREDRRHYLSLMPILHEALDKLAVEQEQEDQFVTLLTSKTGVDIETVRQAITWWKTKVISKRPIVSDDAKAWRMIRQHIKKGA